MSSLLTTEERAFCRLVTKTVSVNHFSPERLTLDCEIAGVPDSYPKKEVFPLVIEKLNSFVEVLEKRDVADITKHSGEDRHFLEYTFLFYIFHRYTDLFDNHIQKQLRSGDTPISVPFWDNALRDFRNSGFTDRQACSLFEIFFQFRRAFYFIETRLVGRSKSIQTLRQNLWNNVFTTKLFLYWEHLLNRMEDFSTIILGGTGTGKGTAAAAIGRSGHIPFDTQKKQFKESFTKAFVSINLSQYPESLLESELFGHRKGAFTGAVEAYNGVFQRCSKHGATFLDEIGEVTIPTQIKLLQVLQERTFSPVGSHEKLRFGGRVIAATNKDIDMLRQEGTFREDFYYRLCSDTIVVPSLQQRISEDPLELNDLVAYVVEKTVGAVHEELNAEVLDVISKKLGLHYSWPGNVRELEQCIRSIIINGSYEPQAVSAKANPLHSLTESLLDDTLDATGLLTEYCTFLYKKHGSFQAVGRVSGLDRRTVKKYVVL